MIHPNMIGIGKWYYVRVLDFSTTRKIKVLHVEQGYMKVLVEGDPLSMLINLEHITTLQDVVDESA